MAPGDFYKRPCDNGLRFEVVMDYAADSPVCQEELSKLEEQGIRVSNDAFIGHFAIELSGQDLKARQDQWLKVASVVCGEIFDEHRQPLELPLAG